MVTHVPPNPRSDRRSVMHCLALAFSLAVAAVVNQDVAGHVDP
jgi:hypothetical protein